jgi:hypothetical protein
MLAKGPFQRSRKFLEKLEKSPKSFDLGLFSVVREAGLQVHVFHPRYSNPSNLAKYK